MIEYSQPTELLRSLIDFPAGCNYRYNDDEKRSLRECLFRAISCDGKYLSWFFPQLVDSRNPEVALRTLGEDFQWSFSKYDAYVSGPRDAETRQNKQSLHKNSPCARIFRRGEPIYRCLTCGFDETTALCSLCYQAEQHEGHVVHISICQRENGGVCDCGDPEAWTGSFVCKSALEDNTCDSFESCSVPLELQERFKATIEILLDYVIDVMSQSDLHLYPPQDFALESQNNSDLCTLNPEKYGHNGQEIFRHDPPSEKYSLIAYNDQVRHFRDAVQRIQLASKKVPEFATMVAEQMQKHGRATVICSQNLQLLSERQRILSATGLASCIRNSRDEMRENMCHDILLWLGNLTGRESFKSNEVIKNVFCHCFSSRWKPGLSNLESNGSDVYTKGRLSSRLRIPNIDSNSTEDFAKSHWSFTPTGWDVDSKLCHECEYNRESQNGISFRGSRFQYLVYFDIRFWRSIRTTLHDIYLSSLITNLRYKKIFCCQYVDIYSTVADSFLSVDGEPELNIMSNLSSQLFTCPSHATTIISHGDLTRIFSTIYNFLRSGEVRPNATDSKVQHNLSMTSLKNRRWGQIFFDIGYVLTRGKAREQVLINNIIPMACDILSLFQGKPVLKREKESHIEYENSDYTAFFHAVSVVYHFAEYISQSITSLGPIHREQVSSNAIEYVVGFLLKLESRTDLGLLVDHNEVDFGKHGCDANSWGKDECMSFLHPLHSFLSWLIEYSNFTSADHLKSTFQSMSSDSSFRRLYSSDSRTCANVIFDYPVQTVVLSSQIKSGFWVRNGFSVRSQLQLYKNTSLREQGYLRDVYLCQVFATCSDPDTVVSVFLEKWLLYQWSVDCDHSNCPYEPSVLQYMLEELLSFFLHILTDDIFLRGLSSEAIAHFQIKSEVIHNLCFGPLTYSELCSQMPEHVYTERKFDMVLDELTVFKKSRSSKETGTYILKEKYFDEVDPYYFNYTINKKDDAIKLLKERIHKIHNIALCDIVIPPRQKNEDTLGIYNSVSSFILSDLFVVFLIRVLTYITSQGASKLEGLLETVLHLIHVSSVESLVNSQQSGSFFDKSAIKSQSSEISLITMLYDMLSKDEFQAHHSKVRAIFERFKVMSGDFDQIMRNSVENFDPDQLNFVMSMAISEGKDERKKRIAKGKQDKLIAKLKKQQSSFSKKNNVVHDCSDTDMDEEEEEGWRFPEPHCILCQDASESAGPFGIITYVSKAAEFRQVPFDDQYWFLKAFSDQPNLNGPKSPVFASENYSEKWESFMNKAKRENVVGPGFTDRKLVHSKLVSSTCGHGMHFNCYMQYLSNNTARQNQITRNNPDSVEHREFLCPLCKALNNMFIPILWSSNNRSLSEFVAPAQDENDSFDVILRQTLDDNTWLAEFCRKTTQDFKKFSNLSPSAKEMIGIDSDGSLSNTHEQFRLLLTNMFQILSSLTFPYIFKADCPRNLMNSIKSTEISLRGTDPCSSLVIYQLSNNTLINLRALNEFRVTSLLMKFANCVQSTSSSQVNAHVKYLSNLQSLSTEKFDNAVTFADFFELLVTIFPAPSASITFNATLRTCFLGIILQNLHIIITQLVTHDFYFNKSYDFFDIPYSRVVSSSDAKNAVDIYLFLRGAILPSRRDESIANQPKFGYIIFTMLLKSVTPFLRQTAIYAYVCCANTDLATTSYTDDIELEANLICSFLKIPNLSEMLRRILGVEDASTWETERLNSFRGYLSKTRGSSFPEEITSPKTMEYPGLIRLAELPERLDEFFTEYYYSEKYQSPHFTIDNPAVCLFCAEVMDAQKRSIGSTHGQCSTHFTRECVSNVGIFLLPKDRCMLLLHRNGGAFHNAPYLDHHGEIPAENKKGRSLHLSTQNYDDFMKNFWLSHNVPNLIVRKLDSVMDAGGWDTL